MTDPTAVQARRATPFWVRLLLVCSLGLNLLVAGLVLGAVTWGAGGDRVARDPGSAAFLRALEPDDRRAVLRQLRREGGGRPVRSRGEMHARMDVLLDAFRAEAFDRDLVERVLGEQVADSASRLAVGQRVLLDHIEGLPREARLAYADRLEQALAEGRRSRP